MELPDGAAAGWMEDMMNYIAGIPTPSAVYRVFKEMESRAEAAEARAADLAESNRELSESVTTLTAECDSAISAAVQAERETQKRRDEAIINLIENDRRIDDDTALSYVNLIRAHYESK